MVVIGGKQSLQGFLYILFMPDTQVVSLVMFIHLFKIQMVSYIKGGTQAKGISKQDPKANIWAQN